MFTKQLTFLAAAALVAAAGCHSRVETATSLKGLEGVASEAETTVSPVEIELRSEAVAEDGTLAARFTSDGRNISPPLSWSGVPEGTAALALVVDSPDAKYGTFAHWVAFNLPADLDRLPEAVPSDSPMSAVVGENGAEAIQGINDFHNVGYDGPCPPEGAAHRYVFRLYALDEPLKLDASATREEVLDAVEGHVLGEGRLTATYARSQAG